MDIQETLTLEEELRQVAKNAGAEIVGFTDRDRLKDAPPSGNITAVLPTACSAIGFAVGISLEAAEAYVTKKDFITLNHEHSEAYKKLAVIGLAIGDFLKSRGFDVHVPLPNFEYREEYGAEKMTPILSHRYICEAAGVGWLGWSGNLLTREYGASILISSVVTSAELEPSPLVEEDWCSRCRICVATCPTFYMPKQEADEVSIAGKTARYSKRRTTWRCLISCSGCNGKKREGAKWSTWSPEYIDGLPGRNESDDEFNQICDTLTAANPNDDLMQGLHTVHINKLGWEIFYNFPKNALTCSLCQYVCVPGMENRQRLYRGLVKSGCIDAYDPQVKDDEPVAASSFKEHFRDLS